MQDAVEKVKLMEEESKSLQYQLTQTKNKRNPLSQQVNEQFRVLTHHDPSFALAVEAEYQVARRMRLLKSQQSVATEEGSASPAVGV